MLNSIILPQRKAVWRTVDISMCIQMPVCPGATPIQQVKIAEGGIKTLVIFKVSFLKILFPEIQVLLTLHDPAQIVAISLLLLCIYVGLLILKSKSISIWFI